ncbi:MAG: DUF1036 domain-containing protein [Rhodopseudomonas sp.]|uniref:DUF1036 domain-containing protein n=1 Tax=Rhodopseudomonas sp. TaxID=1078 RepID=UPI0018098319|nr:DUF1036 domain-containing protein [Rhodopseudomonas sp.]NVN88274.1 DUF1036 domain-containing protein [Rhodopseudomonas sp.]
MSSSILRISIGALTAAVCLLGASGAGAEIIFCNSFGHVVNVAIAYPQSDGSFISRGWLSLSDGACAPFDTAIHVKTFYFRGESVQYRGTDGHMKRVYWGKGDKFAMWEKDNYQYYNARQRVYNSTLMEFTQGPISGGDDVSAKVIFTPDSAIIEIATSPAAQ